MVEVLPGDNYQYALCALITVGYQLFFYAIAATLKFDKVTDLAGGSNFVVLDILTMLLAPSSSPLQIAVNVLVIAWGTRLSLFLFYRIVMIGEDNRFDTMRDDPIKFLGFWIFQILWVYIISLPYIFLNGSDVDDDALSIGEIILIVLCCVGLVIETIADQVKFNFKQQKKPDWCTESIWRYSRHPNYFGEILFWWGVFGLCAGQMNKNGNQWAYFTILSPMFISSLLLFVSGLPILESSMHSRYRDRDDYHEYLKSTSVLIPLPNGTYKNTPEWMKKYFLFEFDMYKTALDERNYKTEHDAITA